MAFLSLELVTFAATVWTLMVLQKKKFDDLFFPPSGVVVFRAPEEEDLKQARELKEQKSKNLNKFKKNFYSNKKATLPVRVQRATSAMFENVKYMSDLELAVMMVYAILITNVISMVANYFSLLPKQFSNPNLSFYLTLCFLFYFIIQLVRIAMIGGFSIYENRLSVMISMTSALLLTALLLVARFLINIDIKSAFNLQIYQIRGIFGIADKSLDVISLDAFLLAFIAIFTVFVYSLVPIIIKYGNSYVGLNKEVSRIESLIQRQEVLKAQAQASENEGEQAQEAGQGDDENTKQLKEVKGALRWFNVGLVFHLLAIFCWIRPITQAWSTHLEDNGLGLEFLRIVFIIAHIVCLFCTYKIEIARYMMRAYDTITTLLEDPSQEKLQLVRFKTNAHLGYMGVMSFQVVMKIMIPLLILLLFVSKRLDIHYQAGEQTKLYTDVKSEGYMDWNCYGTNDPALIFANNDTSAINQRMQVGAVQDGMGIFADNTVTPHADADKLNPLADVLNKLKKYGFLNNSFSYMIISLWLFLYYLVTYIMTLAYIFYRRAIEEI